MYFTVLIASCVIFIKPIVNIKLCVKRVPQKIPLDHDDDDDDDDDDLSYFFFLFSFYFLWGAPVSLF